MSRKTVFALILIAVLILGVAGSIAATLYVNNLPQRLSHHQTLLLGHNQLVPGSQAALRLLVRDSQPIAALDGADQRGAELRRRQAPPLYRPDRVGGTADVNFPVPRASTPADLLIETKSRRGTDAIERPVTVARDNRCCSPPTSPSTSPARSSTSARCRSAFDLAPAAGQALKSPASTPRATGSSQP